MQTTQPNFLSKLLHVAVVLGGLCSGLLFIQPLASAQPANILVNTHVDETECDTQSESAIVVVPPLAPETEYKVIVAFNDSGSRSICRTAAPTDHGIGYSVSNDGGTIFVDNNMTLPMPASTPLPGVYGDYADPVLAYDNRSRTVYLSTLARDFSGIQVFRSFDNGASFQLPVNGATGFNIGNSFDKEWITVDNSSKPGLGQGNVYLVFQKMISDARPSGVYITKSGDGGETWTTSTLVSEDNSHPGAFVTVGTDHTVYVFWFSGNQHQIKMRKVSQDLQFLDPPNSTSTIVAALKNTNSSGSLASGVGRTFPQAAINPTNGDIYVVFNDTGVDGDRGDIFFTRSIDGGITWCPDGTVIDGKAVPCSPRKVNDEVGAAKPTNDQWHPALAVTSDGRHLFIGFYDRRLDPDNSNIDRYGVFGDVNSSNSRVTFRPNFRITTESFPPGVNDPSSTFPLGDYDQATADNKFFYTTWADTRESGKIDPICANDSSKTCPTHVKQPDVRFAKLPVPVDDIPPIVSISSPDSGYVGTFTTLVAKVTDNSDVAKVNFASPCGGTNLKATLSPSLPDTYSVNWDTAGINHGAICPLYAIAYDAAGNFGSKAISVTVDKMPPTVAITSPPQNSIAKGLITLAASATDNAVVKKVTFYLCDGTTIDAAPTASPYSVVWQSAGFIADCNIQVLAYDAAGNVAHNMIKITVDNVSPSVAITSPSQNSTVRGIVRLAATATDNMGVQHVDVYPCDGTGPQRATFTPPSYSVSWDSSGYNIANCIVQALAYDAAGNVGHNAIMITVNNP